MKKTDSFTSYDNVGDGVPDCGDVALRRRASAFLKWVALAACMTLVISLVGISLGTASKEKESGDTPETFGADAVQAEEPDGPDLRPLSKNITMEHFSPDKPAEKICQSISGTEIYQKEYTGKELNELWSQYTPPPVEVESGISYQSGSYDYTSPNGIPEDVLWPKWGLPTHSYLVCHQDGELLWRVNFSYFLIEDQMFTPYGTLVWGMDDGENDECQVIGSSETRDYCTTVLLIDGSGNIRWQRWLDHDLQYGWNIGAVIDNGDGTFATISYGIDKYFAGYLCVTQYDMNGYELSFRKNSETEICLYGKVETDIRAVRVGENYLVQVRDNEIVKLDHEGNFLDRFTYSEEEREYKICDLAEFRGQLCLSVKAELKNPEEKEAESAEESLALDRNKCISLLFLCDPERGELKTFYSVKGFFPENSYFRGLNVNDAGELVWKVMDTVCFRCSPEGESRFPARPANAEEIEAGNIQILSYKFARQIVHCVFDTDGNLAREETLWDTYIHYPNSVNFMG